MLVKFIKKNNQKLKNKKIKLCSLLLSGTIATTLLTGCNKTIFDTKYGFDKALILGDDTSIIMDVCSWKDYEGEQLQLITKDNFVLLSSSFDTNCFYGESQSYSINKVAANSISEYGEIHNLSISDSSTIYNKELFDTKWSFNKAIVFNGNNALVIPILKWRDYDGEQLQVITTDGCVLNLCSYNTKLVFDDYSELKADEFARIYVGTDGNVINWSDSSKSQTFNYDLIDTKYGYNKAIILKDKKAIIIPVSEWCDYEGEQIQIKITDGPTILTASYDTILLNDINSIKKSSDIASSLANEVVDYTKNYNYDSNIIFNGTIIDINYGYSNGIVSNHNSATSFQVSKWLDYEGEQIQVKLATGETILTSSMLLDLIYGGTNILNASTIAASYVDLNGNNIDYSNNNIDTPMYNKFLLDTEVKFTYALKVVNGNVIIFPLKSWRDFYNTDGKKGLNNFPFANTDTIGDVVADALIENIFGKEEKDEEETEEPSPNCEQIQLILPDDSSIVTTMYDTVLVNNATDIKNIAEMFRGENGIVSDLTPYVGEPPSSLWNFTLIDTKYNFTHAILSNGSSIQVFPITKWLDFKEGEQLQIGFKDNTGILTSFVNTTLVDSKTDFLEETIAAAYNGTLETDQPKIKTYK